jgi:predicted metal-binding protein
MPMMKHKKVLDNIISLLKERGASSVILINSADIIIDERVRLKCRVPVCDSYNKNLMCPPHVPSVAEFRETLKKYKKAILLQVSSELSEKSAKAPTEEVFLPARKLHELVNLGEREAFAAGFRFAAGFIGGCCRLCDECIAAQGGTSCRVPFKARPSMEAMGIDVIATAEKAGLPLTFPIKNKVTWTGLILL